VVKSSKRIKGNTLAPVNIADLKPEMENAARVGVLSTAPPRMIESK